MPVIIASGANMNSINGFENRHTFEPQLLNTNDNWLESFNVADNSTAVNPTDSIVDINTSRGASNPFEATS